MKTKLLLFSALPLAVLLTGCASNGLSRREVAGVSYPNYILNLPAKKTDVARPPLTKPLRLAVAQVGESAPPKDLLNRLEANRDCVASVVGLPAPAESGNHYHGPDDKSQDKQAEFSTRVQSLCRLAKTLDADYLFICGGDTAWWRDSNPLRVFDVTIVGGMLIPSTKIITEGRAAGALIDTTTCEPVLLVSTDGNLSRHAPSFYAEQKADAQTVALRNQLVADLADEFLKKVAQPVSR